VADDLAGQFDAVVMRCAGSLDTVLPLAERLARPGGVVVVSGPPAPPPAGPGDWIEVEALHRRGRRWFLVRRV
jgi:hypothetical protein